jgi:hypothetical protein
MIAMDTRGRTGLSHLLAGSVCEQVVRGGVAPVMVLRPALTWCAHHALRADGIPSSGGGEGMPLSSGNTTQPLHQLTECDAQAGRLEAGTGASRFSNQWCAYGSSLNGSTST